MLVLVLGASGFIGLPVAQALVRAGHIVYGQTRSAEAAERLAAEEVIPVVGDPAEATTWSHMIATLDVVIDCTRSEDTTTLMQAVFKLVTDGASRLRPANAPKLTFISTSGTGPHGSSRTEFVTDTTPCTRPIPLAVGRVDLEQNIVKNSVINGIVIRPSLLYGRSGSLFDIMFSSAAKGKAEWYGTPGGRFALIHTDDLADLYLRAAEKAQLVGGMIFTAANDFTESVDDVLAKVTEVSGAKEAPEYFDTAGNPFLDMLGTTLLVRPYLARTLLGWQPRKMGLVEGMSIYYAAWKAASHRSQYI